MRTVLKVLLLTMAFNLGSLNSIAQTNEYDDELDKFSSLLKTVNLYYVDSVDNHELIESAIVSMLEKMDPHSVYIPKEELKRMNEPLVGNFDGIGVRFNILRDTITVVSPIVGGPSEKLGIRAGDKIVEIENESVAGIGIQNSDVMRLLRGKKGTKVAIGITRNGESELQNYTIIRDKIPILSVDASYMATPEIGYIKLSRFSRKSHEEVTEKMAELKELGMKHLIFDLRGNGGGYLETASKIADEFLDDNRLIVYTEGLQHRKQDLKATERGNFHKGKLVILMDEGSASASEIVAGAVQDWDRGLIIGRKSFGKGLVQKQFYLTDRSAIRLTTARYYTPSGRCIQKPYDSGKDDYYEEINKRLTSGELYIADSIKFPDSLKYETNAKRVVFGGGGIMPDVFVPLDTTEGSDYYGSLIRKGMFNEFILTYLQNHRDEMKEEYASFDTYQNEFNAKASLLNKFTSYAEKNGVAIDKEGLKTSGNLISMQLKALIAQNLWSSSEYFEVWNQQNNTYQKAVEAIEGNLFNRSKLSYK